jgi:anaerobic magnesium-protoporphyrin IX monomethyl ester cyclase
MPKPYRHVLCLYPYRRELPKVGFFPPLGLEYIAAALKPYAQKIDIVDLRKDRSHEPFIRPETDLVCVSCNWHHEEKYYAEIINSLPPGPTVIVGGRHATMNADRFIGEMPRIDILVRGDGEEIIREIAEGVPLEKIDGITWRKNGNAVYNRPHDYSEVDNDIVPDRGLRRHRYTMQIGGVDLGIPIDLIAMTRGCPYRCKFCTFARNEHSAPRPFTARPAESIIRELRGVEAKVLVAADDNFTHDLDRLESVCDALIDSRLNKMLIVNGRSDIAKRPHVVRKMHDAGVRAIYIGVESARDKTLEYYGKGITTETFRRRMEVLRKVKIWYHGTFIIGAPGEIEEGMLEIADYSHELGLDSIGVSRLRCPKNTPLYDELAGKPGFHVADDGKVHSDEFPRSRLKKIQNEILKRFYTPRQILKIADKVLYNKIVPLRFFLELFALPARFAARKLKGPK